MVIYVPAKTAETGPECLLSPIQGPLSLRMCSGSSPKFLPRPQVMSTGVTRLRPQPRGENMPCPLSALACMAGSRGVVELEAHEVALLRRVCKDVTPTRGKSKVLK